MNFHRQWAGDPFVMHLIIIIIKYWSGSSENTLKFKQQFAISRLLAHSGRFERLGHARKSSIAQNIDVFYSLLAFFP